MTLGCLVSVTLRDLSLAVGFIERAVKKDSLSLRVSCVAEISTGGNQSGGVEVGWSELSLGSKGRLRE